jgi:hypothetical protein
MRDKRELYQQALQTSEMLICTFSKMFSFNVIYISQNIYVNIEYVFLGDIKQFISSNHNTLNVGCTMV